jgi:four helix bundle protein
MAKRHRRFEDLPVWQVATELAVQVFRLSSRGVFAGHPGLKDQIERAVVSISNNIAEGWERGTHEELLTFLYYARGSAGEVRSMLRFLSRLESSEDAVPTRAPLGAASAHPRESMASSRSGPALDDLLNLADNVSRQLGSWLESLKDSDEQGPRYRNQATRQAADQSRRAAAFLEHLRHIQEQARVTAPPRQEDPPSGPEYPRD